MNDVFKSLGATTRSAFINANLQGINISCSFEVPRNAIKQLGLHRTFNSLRSSPLHGTTISIGHVGFKPMKLCVRQRNIYEVTSDAASSLQRSLYQMSLAQRIGRVYSPFKVSERKGKTTGRFVAPQEIPGRFTIIQVPSQEAKVKVIEELRIPVDSRGELYAAAKQLAKKEEEYREISDKLRTLGLTM